jgi:hypothetical protein
VFQTSNLGLWLLKILLIALGSWFIYKGLSLTEKEKERLADATPVGDTAMGCLVSLIAGIIFAGLLRLMPLWFVRILWILMVIVFIVAAVKVSGVKLNVHLR